MFIARAIYFKGTKSSFFLILLTLRSSRFFPNKLYTIYTSADLDTLRQTASTKSHVNVGTIGHIGMLHYKHSNIIFKHVDHGKTTLSSAITKC